MFGYRLFWTHCSLSKSLCQLFGSNKLKFFTLGLLQILFYLFFTRYLSYLATKPRLRSTICFPFDFDVNSQQIKGFWWISANWFFSFKREGLFISDWYIIQLQLFSTFHRHKVGMFQVGRTKARSQTMPNIIFWLPLRLSPSTALIFGYSEVNFPSPSTNFKQSQFFCPQNRWTQFNSPFGKVSWVEICDY